VRSFEVDARSVGIAHPDEQVDPAIAVEVGGAYRDARHLAGEALPEGFDSG
jgi:hypothetical protein